MIAADQQGGVCGELCGEQWDLHYGIQSHGDGCGVLVPLGLCPYFHTWTVCARAVLQHLGTYIHTHTAHCIFTLSINPNLHGLSGSCLT